jgi:hypothetical protein
MNSTWVLIVSHASGDVKLAALLQGCTYLLHVSQYSSVE